MKEKNVFREFGKYVALNIGGQLAYSCYTLADTFFISAALGANGLTALNLAFPVFCLISGTGLMIGMGGGTLYSIFKSRKEYQRANQIFTNAIYMTAGFSILYVFLGTFFSKMLVKALGADSTLFPMTHTYLQVLLLFSPAFLTNHFLQCFVRNDGRPSLSTAAMTIGSFSNVLLDYLFIFPLHMGIFGAILATGIAPIISLLVLSPYFIGQKNAFHFVKSRPEAKRIQEITASGIPPLITEISSGIVMFLFNFIILRLAGNTGVAAFSVVTVVSLVVVAIYTGLSQGMQPVVSANHGEGNTDAVKAVLKYALIAALLLSGAIYAILFLGASIIVSVFNKENNELLQTFAITGLQLYFIACPFIGFNILTATFLTATERPRPAQLISLMRGFFVLVPTAFLLSALLKMMGVWCAYPATECIVAFTGVFLLRKSNKGFSKPPEAETPTKL